MTCAAPGTRISNVRLNCNNNVTKTQQVDALVLGINTGSRHHDNVIDAKWAPKSKSRHKERSHMSLCLLVLSPVARCSPDAEVMLTYFVACLTS